MKHGKRGRDLQGLLLLDKAAGLSSNQALQQVKRLFNAAKAGHTGSLDPLASGLLPLCFGQATRLAAFLLDSRKSYEVDLVLGTNTTTGDAEGEVKQQRPVPEISDTELTRILQGFKGESQQYPPMYSALKHKGVRLYEYARKGVEIERVPRTIRIDDLVLRLYSRPRISLAVSCSKGTYIRTLVEDIGEVIGCGAYVEKLRRTGVGCFQVQDAWTIEALNALSSENRDLQCLLPMDAAVARFPKLELAEELVRVASQGQMLKIYDPPPAGWVRMYTQDCRFFGLGEVLPDQRVAPRKIFKNDC